MTHSLPPPRGIFVPTHMIFNSQLPPAALVTWIQLRSLAWDGWVTSPLSISELAALTGKRQSMLYRHMSQLRHLSALSWRSTGLGTIIVSFPEELSGMPNKQAGPLNILDSTILNSQNRELPDPPSYFPPRIMGYLSFHEDQEAFSF
jgi:hypothetical protein